MEVGAVKQAFNNEVIQLKRNLNQAKIQTIHKLTRKAKTFVEKKAPEKLKEKLKRKAESAVKEVLIIKKVKPKDVAKFAVTHTGDLQNYLNKPVVDQDKVCARLLLHKSLQDKYKYIRNTFSNIPINDLLMSRQERRRMKKEQQEKQKMKKDKKQKVVNAEGEWEVENIKTSKKNTLPSENELSAEDESMESNEEANSGDEKTHSDDEELIDEEGSQSDEEIVDDDEEEEEEEDEAEVKEETDQETDNDEDLHEQSDDDTKVGKFVRPSPVKRDPNPKTKIANPQTKIVATPAFSQLGKGKTKPDIKKQRDANKNKNLNEKLLSRKFKKTDESEVQETKVVDPFFITSTGENYMSVAEPRQPDEVKEIHKEGNRKLRRAVMFGHVPKIKPRSDNSYRQNGRQGGFRNGSNRSGDGNYKNDFNRNDSQFKGRNDSQFKGRNDKEFKGKNDNFKGRNDNQFRGRSEFKNDRNNDTAEPKVEKLHPSWEAKKKKSGILPFQGKKIVFDES